MDVKFQVTQQNDKTFLMDSIAHCTEVELMCVMNKQPIEINVSFGNDEDNTEEKED